MSYLSAIASVLLSLHLLGIAHSFQQTLSTMQRSWLLLHGPTRFAVPKICRELASSRNNYSTPCRSQLSVRHYGRRRDACQLLAVKRLSFLPRYYRLEMQCQLLPAPFSKHSLRIFNVSWQVLQ